MKPNNFSRVHLQSASDVSNASVVTLLYCTEDEGKNLRDWTQKNIPALIQKFEKEPSLGVLKGVPGEQAWFQTDAQSFLILCLGDTKRKDSLAVRYETEKLIRAALGRSPTTIALKMIGFSKREEMIAAEAAVIAGYSFRTLKTESTPMKTCELRLLSDQLSESDIKQAQAIAIGTCAARELAILPANVATPKGVVERARDWLEGSGLEIQVWGRAECEKKGMGLFLSVGRGSDNEPQMMSIRYQPQSSSSKRVLGFVGKGVTFDTGGYNLKTVPFRELLDMKADMGGAAGVIGAMLAIAELKPSVPVVAVTGLTDNMISSTATHPGDVVKSMSGITVEIQNTDAEGRLVLSDAITLAKQQGVTHLVDVATLTGACVVALGKYYTGMMTNHREWAAEVSHVANENGEPVWELPLNFRHFDEIKSDVADLSNVGKGRDGGAMIAGAFLQKFVGETPWVHLDIAGSADYTPNGGIHGTAKYAGIMASTLARLSMNR